MPPRAMRVSVVSTSWRALPLPVRFQNRSMNSQFMGWGNLGAPSEPPLRSSAWAESPWYAENSTSSVRSVVDPRRRSPRPSWDAIWVEDCSTSPRRVRHASAMDWSRRGKPGSP